MDFVREIIESDRLAGIVNIPETLRHSPVEIIVLPVRDKDNTVAYLQEKKMQKEKYKDLYQNPIKVKKIKLFSREELHDR